jgi:hypothetical protein
MRNRVLQIMICLALVLILSSSGVCTILSLYSDKTPCQKDSHLDNGVHVTISRLCKILPCSLTQFHFFTLQEISLRRLKTENRSFLNDSKQAALSTAEGVILNDQMVKAALKIPLSFKTPPIFYLHCILIC